MRVPAYVAYRRRKPKAAIAALRTAARLILATAGLYLVVTTFLLSSVRVASVSMQPAVHSGDRFFVAPIVYGGRIPLTRARLPGFRVPARGDVVLVEAPQTSGRRGVGRAADGVLRFLTAQRVSVYPDEASGGISRLLVKRVVGLPGDALRMEGYRAWIRPAGSAEYLSEETLSGRSYEVSLGDRDPPPREVPLGGYLAEITVGAGQYFLLGDNRPDSSDSRSWGPVRMERIIGPVLLRYYPFRRFGGM